MIGYHTILSPDIAAAPVDPQQVKNLFLTMWGAIAFMDISIFTPALIRSQKLETPEGVAAFWLVAQVYGHCDDKGEFDYAFIDPLEAWEVALNLDSVLREAEALPAAA